MGSLIETAGRIIGQVQVALEDARRKCILTNPLACGRTTMGIDLRDDAPPNHLLDDQLDPELKKYLLEQTNAWAYLPGIDTYVSYNSSEHGGFDKGAWLREGNPIPGIEPLEGKIAIHRHDGAQWSGAWRFNWEEPSD